MDAPRRRSPNPALRQINGTSTLCQRAGNGPVWFNGAMENLRADGEEDIAKILDEAQQNAREQRLAAERFLQETLALEQRLAQEAEAARNAGDLARKRE